MPCNDPQDPIALHNYRLPTIDNGYTAIAIYKLNSRDVDNENQTVKEFVSTFICVHTDSEEIIWRRSGRVQIARNPMKQ